ncbi:MAG: HisA/HisF-related TIM barrel protein, partial [Bacteroidota bacterium]
LDVHDGKIAHSGWLEESDYLPNTFLFDMIHAKATTFVCTDVARDGMMEGPNLDLYKEIRSFFESIELIACGGVTTLRDVHALAELDVNGVVVGKAIYEGKLKLEELKGFSA